MKNLLILIAVCMFTLVGCAASKKADREVRETSLIVLQQVLTLKAEVRKKIAAEQQYYRNTINTLDSSRERFSYTNFNRSLIENAMKAAADLRKDSSTISMDAVSEKLVSPANDIIDAFDIGTQERRKHRATAEASLEKLRTLEKEYTVLQQSLVELSIPIKSREQIEHIGQFIVDAAKFYKQLEKSEATKTPTD